MAGKVKILLVDDHQMVREGLRHLLEKGARMKVIAEAGDGETCLSMVKQHRPQIVVMDVALPGLNGIETTRKVLAKYSKTRVIALSMHSDTRFVLGMLQAGARGYLLKDCAFEELTRAVDAVMAGETYLSPDIAVKIRDHCVEQNAPGANGGAASAITPREREVLQLLAQGFNTKKIATSLGVSPKTVETHRLHLKQRLDLHTVAELTKYAIREGLTTVDE